MANRGGDGVEASRCSFAQEVLQLGEELFDRIEVGRVFRQEEQLGAGGTNGTSDRVPLVAAEIVHHDDVARSQGWDEDLLDIEAERLAVDRTGEQPWRLDAIVPERGEEGHGFPAPLRYFRAEPLSARSPSPQRCHIGLGPGLVDEDEAGRLNPILIGQPLRPPARDVGAILLAGVHGFF